MRLTPMTVAGEKALRDELSRLKTEDRPRIIQSIAIAREHGDLKENAEYHAAREQQGFCEGRIQEIEGKLGESQIIDVTSIAYTGKVIFGVTVTIINIETDETVKYRCGIRNWFSRAYLKRKSLLKKRRKPLFFVYNFFAYKKCLNY